MKISHILFIIITALVITACSAGTPPDTVIENYLTALVNGDNPQAVSLSCAAWEENANAEGASFEGVEVRLDEMDCTTIELGDSNASVTCEGYIVFSYAGGEDEVIPLSRRDYSLALEGGEWRMCGYE